VALVVLVLEKDRGRLFRYEEILAALGYEPIGFTTLREVPLADAARARIDAALVCHQPGTNSALEFAAALHDIAPSLPIILVTPSARDLDAPILVTSGISEVVHDPVTSGELAGALSRCLNSRNEQLWDDRSWQIVLQNSFWNTEDKFAGLWARRSNNHAGDHSNYRRAHQQLR
jgi:DNA-binding NtrC family response regulator